MSINDPSQVYDYRDYTHRRDLAVYQSICRINNPGDACKDEDKLVTPGAMWKSSYCPLTSDTKDHKIATLSSGQYGTAYRVTLNDGTNYIFKSYKSLPFSNDYPPFKLKNKGTVNPSEMAIFYTMLVDELKRVNLGVKDIDHIVNIGADKKPLKSDYACELAALAYSSYLTRNNISLNMPTLFGMSHCPPSTKDDLYGQYYLYMKAIDNTLKNITMTKDDISCILVQGIMTIMSMYTIGLQHGNIDANNCGIIQIPTHDTRSALYYSDQKQTCIVSTSESKYIFTLIDFGMGFVRHKVEPEARVQRDVNRINEGINWSSDKKNVQKTDHSIDPVYYYKGLVTPRPDQLGGLYDQSIDYHELAFVRRHLYDFICFFYMINGLQSKIKDKIEVTKLFDEVYKVFTNPVQYIKGSGSDVFDICHDMILSICSQSGLIYRHSGHWSTIDSKYKLRYLGQFTV
jgi:hypothetical protein